MQVTDADATQLLIYVCLEYSAHCLRKRLEDVAELLLLNLVVWALKQHFAPQRKEELTRERIATCGEVC